MAKRNVVPLTPTQKLVYAAKMLLSAYALIKQQDYVQAKIHIWIANNYLH